MRELWNPYKVIDDFKINCFFSAFIRECTHEYFYQGETHDFWELCYVIRGSVCISADDRVIKLSENQMIFHKPMEFHSLRTDQEKNTQFLIISFSAEGEFIDFFRDKTFTLNHAQKQEVAKIINFLKNTYRPQNADFIPIVYLKEISKMPTGLKMFRNYVENMLYILSESRESDAQIVKNTETDIYTDALRIINDYCHERLTVEKLARKCNVSSSYLKKLFAKYNGLGIHEYILQNKISIAKQMLSDGETVTNVADALGFSSQNYFSTAFKRKTGYSPSEYTLV